MLQVPVTVRLATWGTAMLRGRVPPPAALAAVQVAGQDGAQPHLLALADPPSSGPDPGGAPALSPAVRAAADGADATLGDLLAALRELPGAWLRVVLPAPGDVAGLPGPPAFNSDALAAGECVLVHLEGPAGPAVAGLVPQTQRLGPAGDQVVQVIWHAHAVRSRPHLDVIGPAEADRTLREALAQATGTLAELDVARWRDDAADRIAAVRQGLLARSALPPGTPARVVQVVSTAARVRAIVQLAELDDGAAISGWQVQRRADALRALDAVARRALVGAVAEALHDQP